MPVYFPSFRRVKPCKLRKLRRSFVCRQRVVVGQWLTGARVLLPATRGLSDSGPTGQLVFQMFFPREKLYSQ